MRRCFLKGQMGDALNVVLAAAGYNIRWLMRHLVFTWAEILSLLNSSSRAAGQTIADQAVINPPQAVMA